CVNDRPSRARTAHRSPALTIRRIRRWSNENAGRGIQVGVRQDLERTNDSTLLESADRAIQFGRVRTSDGRIVLIETFREGSVDRLNANENSTVLEDLVAISLGEHRIPSQRCYLSQISHETEARFL